MKEANKEIRKLLLYINDTPELQSLLYDMDLLPEQCEHGSRDWRNMLLLAERWKKIVNPNEWTEDREPWRNSGNIVMFQDSQAIALAATEHDAELIKTAHNAAPPSRLSPLTEPKKPISSR